MRNTSHRFAKTIFYSAAVLAALFVSINAARGLADQNKPAAQPQNKVAHEAPAPATPPAAEQPLSAEQSKLVTATATVEAIDQKTREVTLKGPLGDTVTFVADKSIKRLNEVKVGDTV